MPAESPYRYVNALQIDVGRPRAELLSLLADRGQALDRRTAAFVLLTSGNTLSKLEPVLLALDDVALCRHSLFIVGVARSLGWAERRNRIAPEHCKAVAAAKPHICERLLAILAAGGDDWFVAMDALAQFRDERLRPWCMRLLNDSDPRTRTRAVHLLGRLGTEHAQQILEVVFQTDPSDRVRGVAAIVLGENGNPIAQETLLRCPQWDWWVISSLCCLGHPRAIAELRSRTQEASDDSVLRNILQQRLLPQITGAANWRQIVIDWADERLRSIAGC